MDTKTIILDIIMFASYLANIIFIVRKCIQLPQGLKTLAEDCKGLNNKETVDLHHKRFISPVFQIMWVNLIFMIIGAVTCVNDGLSDTENLLVVPVWTIVIVGVLLSGFLIAYVDILKRKYNIEMSYKGDWVGNLGTSSGAQIGACIFGSLFFGFNTGFIAYTIALLLI